MKRLLCFSVLAAVFMLPSVPAKAEILAALEYPSTSAGAAATVVGQTPGAAVTVDSSNDGDWQIFFGGDVYSHDSGVIIPASYADYSANDIGASGSPRRGFIEVPGIYTEDVPVASFAPGWLALTDISGGGSEANFNVGLAYYPYSDGYISGNVSSTGAINVGNTSGVTVTKDPDDAGRWEFSIDGVNSVTDGMLFTVGGDNSASGNVVTTEVLSDGSGWHIMSFDQGGTFADDDGDADGDGGQDGTFQFIYIPYSTPGMVGGRVSDDGTILNGVGNFNVTHVSEGEYLLQVNGGTFTDEDGILFAVPSKGTAFEGGDALDPDDNFLEFSYSEDDDAWRILSSDLNAANAQDTEFVFMVKAFNNVVPEPSHYALVFALATLAFVAIRRRK